MSSAYKAFTVPTSTVILTQDQRDHAVEVGQARFAVNPNAPHKPGFLHPLAANISQACAELAVSLLLDDYWSGGNTIDLTPISLYASGAEVGMTNKVKRLVHSNTWHLNLWKRSNEADLRLWAAFPHDSDIREDRYKTVEILGYIDTTLAWDTCLDHVGDDTCACGISPYDKGKQTRLRMDLRHLTTYWGTTFPEEPLY